MGCSYYGFEDAHTWLVARELGSQNDGCDELLVAFGALH